MNTILSEKLYMADSGSVKNFIIISLSSDVSNLQKIWYDKYPKSGIWKNRIF